MLEKINHVNCIPLIVKSNIFFIVVNQFETLRSSNQPLSSKSNLRFTIKSNQRTHRFSANLTRVSKFQILARANVINYKISNENTSNARVQASAPPTAKLAKQLFGIRPHSRTPSLIAFHFPTHKQPLREKIRTLCSYSVSKQQTGVDVKFAVSRPTVPLLGATCK